MSLIYQPKSSILSWLTHIASFISVLVLVATAAGLLHAWAIFLVPLWVGILCYLHLDNVVALVTGAGED